jgi:hypothetical protein
MCGLAAMFLTKMQQSPANGYDTTRSSSATNDEEQDERLIP